MIRRISWTKDVFLLFSLFVPAGSAGTLTSEEDQEDLRVQVTQVLWSELSAKIATAMTQMQVCQNVFKQLLKQLLSGF